MRAVLKSLEFDPDPSTLSGDPAEFMLLARMIVGPIDSPGEESFDVTICSPEWLAAASRKVGIYDARHHLVVNVQDLDLSMIRSWLTARVQEVAGESWPDIGERLARLGYWEFEDYQP